MSNVIICMEAEGNHFRVHYDTPDLQVVYRGGAYFGVKSDTEVMGAGSYLGGGKRIRQRKKG